MEIIAAGLLGTGDHQVVDAYMGRQGGTVIDGVGNIFPR